MASRAPPIPPEQRSSPGDRPNIKGGRRDRRETKTDLQSSRSGPDVSLREQSRHHQGFQQDR